MMKMHDLRVAMLGLAVAGCAIHGALLLGLRAASASASGGSSGGGGGGGGGGGAAAPVRAPAVYAWCAGVAAETAGVSADDAVDPDAAPGFALRSIVQELCHPSDAGRARRDAIEGARRRWMARLLMTEADWGDAVAWSQLPDVERLAPRRLPAPEGRAWSALGPIDQWALLRVETGASASFALQPGALYYAADALPPTEAGRLAFVERCMFLSGVADDPHPVPWAVCQADLDALDAGKLAAEVRGEAARAPAERMGVRLAYDAVRRHQPKHAAKVQRLVAKDAAYARAFELARAARAEWAARAPGRAALLAAVAAMDDARATRSRRAAEGCAEARSLRADLDTGAPGSRRHADRQGRSPEWVTASDSERAWPLYEAAISRLPAKRFEGLRGDPSRAQTFADAAVGAVLQDADAYLAANALYACEGPADLLLAKLGAGLATWPGFRGPRTAALTQLRLAGLEPDARGESIAVPRFELPLALDGDVRPATGGGSVEGVVAAATREEEGVRVTFTASSEVQEQCASRRTTSRISRIDSSGNVVYEAVCTGWRRVRVNTTPEPVVVPARYAGGLARTRYVSIVGGVPEAVWASAAAPLPIAVFGVMLGARR